VITGFVFITISVVGFFMLVKTDFPTPIENFINGKLKTYLAIAIIFLPV
jgi:hypothetical protein